LSDISIGIWYIQNPSLIKILTQKNIKCYDLKCLIHSGNIMQKKIILGLSISGVCFADPITQERISELPFPIGSNQQMLKGGWDIITPLDVLSQKPTERLRSKSLEKADVSKAEQESGKMNNQRFQPLNQKPTYWERFTTFVKETVQKVVTCLRSFF